MGDSLLKRPAVWGRSQFCNRDDCCPSLSTYYCPGPELSALRGSLVEFSCQYPGRRSSGHADLQGRELGCGEAYSLTEAHTASGQLGWLPRLSLATSTNRLPCLASAHRPELPTVAPKPLGGVEDGVSPFRIRLDLVSLHFSRDTPSLGGDQRHRT